MTDEIRRALEARINASAGAPARQARIRATIAGLEEEGKPARKRPFTRVLALALVSMLLVGTGLAAGLRLNLFDMLSQIPRGDQHYWEQDQLKLNSLREKNTLISTSSTAPEGVYPEKMIGVHDAYYDGHVLLVGFVRGAYAWFQPFIEWTPTEEEWAEHAASARPVDKDGSYLLSEAADAILQQAMKTNQPCGIKSYRITNPYDFETTAGTRLWTGLTRYSEPMGDDSNGSYIVEQFASPLPEEIRDQDAIDIQIPFIFTTEYFWFDGGDLYSWYGPQEQAMLTVNIGRDEQVPQGRYESETIILNGVEVAVEAEAIGPYLLHMTLSADAPYFSPAQAVWQWTAQDETGQEQVMSVSAYDEAGLMLNPMQQKVVYDLGRATEHALVFYDDCSEDGRSKELWLDLLGEIPETLTVVIAQDDMDVATVTLRLAE